MFSKFRERSQAAKDEPLVPVAFGKIWSMGDFVVTAGRSDTLKRYEAFLGNCMDWAQERRPVWKEAYKRGGVQAFAYRLPSAAKDPSLVVGVMRPSTDAIGRLHPMAVAVRAPLAPFLSAPHLVPLVFTSFFHNATEALPYLADARSLAELQALVERIEVPTLANIDETAALYATWSRTGALRDVWAALFGPYGDSHLPLVAVQAIIDSASPFRGKESPPTPLGLKLPLGEAAGEGAAFWIDLLRHAARWKQTVPSFFWSNDDTMLLQLGDEVPTTVLADLWCPQYESDHIYSPLIPVDSVKPPSTAVPMALDAILRDPSLTVSGLAGTLAG